MRFFDANVAFGRWPFRRVPELSLSDLKANLESCGIQESIVSPLRAVFHDDPDEANQSLLNDTYGSNFYHAAPVLNLRMANWPTLLNEYRSRHSIAGVRIYPNFHGYPAGSQAVSDLAHALAEASLPLFVPIRMEDERFQNPQMQVPLVPMDALADLAASSPKTTVVCLNAYRKEIVAGETPANLIFDLAFVDWFKPVDDLLRHLPSERVVFGSNAPLFTPMAGVMKVRWADAPATERQKIAAGTITNILGGIS